MNTRICFKTDSFSNWETLNPVLFNGEFGIVQNSSCSRLKVGDGKNLFSHLSYWQPEAIPEEKIEEYKNIYLLYLGTKNACIGQSILGR